MRKINYQKLWHFKRAYIIILCFVLWGNSQGFANPNDSSNFVKEEPVENLLTNGSFEDALTGWTGPEASLRTNDYFPIDGTHHLTVRNIDTEAIQVVTDLLPGTTYILSGYIRNNSSSNPEAVRLGVRNYGGDELFVVHTETGWPTEPYTIEFTLGDENTSAEVFVGNTLGSNWAYADAFNLIAFEEVETIAVSGVELNETAAELEVGETFALVASVLPADATDQTVTWTSSDETVATVDDNGLVTAIEVGEATITVTTTDGAFEASTTITVVPAVENLFVNGSFEDGLTGWSGPEASLRTNDYFPIDGTHHLTVRNIDTEATQVVSDLMPGTTYILSGYIRNNSSSNPEAVRLGVRNYGGDELFVAHTDEGWPTEPYEIEFTLADDNTSVEVFVGNTLGSNWAYADALKMIAVQYVDSIAVTGVELNETSVELEVGETFTLVASVLPADATDQTVTWTSSDETVATVDDNGVVTAIEEGEAMIKVTTTDGAFEASTTITVVPAVENLLVNGSFEDDLIGWVGSLASLRTYDFFPVDGTHHLAVRDVNTDAAQVVTGLIPGGTYLLSGYIRNNPSSVYEEVQLGVRAFGGSDTIIADTTSLDNWPSEPYTIEFTLGPDNTSAEVFVMNAAGSNWAYADALKLSYLGTFQIAVTGVELDETNKELFIGESFLLTATVFPENATDKTVSWSSSDESVATVTQDGLVNAIGEGETTITVKTTDGEFIAEASVTVLIDDTSVDGISNLSAFSLYPNPVSNGRELFISSSEMGEKITVQLISIDGRVLLEKDIVVTGNGIFPIHLSDNFKQGIYLINVFDGKSRQTLKLNILK